MLKAFSHVMLYVHDVARAAKWYADNLGFKPRMVAAPHYAILQHDGMKFRLDLHPDKSTSHNVGNGAQTYFATDSIDADVQALRAKGVKVEDPRSESGSPRFCNFTDSEGNILGLTEAR
jgi:predicted enzyme related to lactoylglutathione lyase